MPQALANQIAAGEVVERPASCVKELVENSLDAGATRVSVTLVDGGIACMAVEDDGKGMDKEDAVMAFARHATSKIQTELDLTRIHTLGFRGEALASIAAVARVTLETRQVGAEHGWRVHAEGSDMVSPPEGVGRAPGTLVEVRDLFFNTPARLKYLRSVQTEQTRCIEVVQQAALSRPDVAFRCQLGDRLLFQTPGRGNLLDVLAVLYGVGEARQFLKVESSNPDYQIVGYVGRPTQGKSSRIHGHWFINGRPVRNYALHQAVVDGYKGRLMVHRHPIYALFLTLDATLVDVNIHPHKSEVRFSEERDVVRLVQAAVAGTLDEAFLVPGMSRPHPIADSRMPTETTSSQTDAARPLEGRQQGTLWRAAEPPAAAYGAGPDAQGGTLWQSAGQRAGSQPDSSSQRQLQPDGRWLSRSPQKAVRQDGQQQGARSAVRRSIAETAAATEMYRPQPDQIQTSQTDAEPTDAGKVHAEPTDAEQTDVDLTVGNSSQMPGVSGDLSSLTELSGRDLLRQLRPIGQALTTYILAEAGDTLFIIDQHAAHERVLYERFRKETEVGGLKLIPLLTPLTLSLTPAQLQGIEQHGEELASLGLAVEEFGGREIIVRTIPQVWEGLDAPSLVEGVLHSLESNLHHPDVREAMREEVVMRACKAAIKAHQRLSDMEIQALCQALAEADDPFHCPHGRPVLIRMSNRDLEKEFRRIV